MPLYPLKEVLKLASFCLISFFQNEIIKVKFSYKFTLHILLPISIKRKIWNTIPDFGVIFGIQFPILA